MGSAARGDARNARLADALGVTVVSVEHRLAPAKPWPAAPDDCETAALWLIEEARKLFGTERMLIGGASAGATLATTTLLRLRDRDLVNPIVGAGVPGVGAWLHLTPDAHGRGRSGWGSDLACEPTGGAAAPGGLATSYRQSGAVVPGSRFGPERGEGCLTRHYIG